MNESFAIKNTNRKTSKLKGHNFIDLLETKKNLGLAA